MSELTGISQRHPLTSLIFILLTAILGFLIIGPLIGFFMAMPFYDGSLFDLVEKIQHPLQSPEVKLPVLIIQASATLIGLIMIPYLYLKGFDRVDPVSWLTSKSISPIMAIVVTLVVITFMAPNSIFIEWNANFIFPEFLKEFGAWAREREDLATELTRFFTTFESPGEFLFGLVVIAILPAIGEELVFRGMIQPELYRATGNHHIAIWVAAIIFSAFHMQFFGFIPRVLLGALFGYLYAWSGNFWMPVIGHFVNNGFSVIMMYLYQLGVIEVDLDSPEAAPWILVIPATVIFVALMYYFRSYYQKQPE